MELRAGGQVSGGLGHLQYIKRPHHIKRPHVNSLAFSSLCPFDINLHPEATHTNTIIYPHEDSDTSPLLRRCRKEVRQKRNKKEKNKDF